MRPAFAHSGLFCGPFLVVRGGLPGGRGGWLIGRVAERFTDGRVPDPGVRALFARQSRWQCWLDVEAALAAAEAQCGVIPAAAAQAITSAAWLETLDVARIERGIAETSHPLMAWLADAQSAGRKGEYVEPSRQRFGAYGAEVIDGLRIGPQTKASYVKNWRLHIAACPIAELPLAQLTGQRLTSHYRMLEASGRKDHRAGEGLSPRTVRYLHTIIHGVLG